MGLLTFAVTSLLLGAFMALVAAGLLIRADHGGYLSRWRGSKRRW